MDINYRMEDDLNWNEAEYVDINPKGWKPVRVWFIDSQPFVFWRINDIPRNFRSYSFSVSISGAHQFFSDALISLKSTLNSAMAKMTDERKMFYQENIVELFNE
jgi:hypothetical protein